MMKVTCPICRKEEEWEGNPFRPFCSERCKMIDLGRWASESYRMPTRPEEGEENSPPESSEEDSEARQKGIPGSHSNGRQSGNSKAP